MLAKMVVALAILSGPASAQHVPLDDPEDGWSDVPLRFDNAFDSAAAMRCQIILAHWFEIGVGPIPPGDSVTIDLLVRPESGDVAILNEPGDRMRVERIACGVSDGQRAEWYEPVLDGLRGRSDATTLSCTGASACRFLP